MKLLQRSPKLTKRDERLVFSLQLLGDKTRYKLFKLLMQDSELCVTEIAEKLNVSVPAVSQHFRMYERAGIVDKKRMGQKICYMLREDDLVTQITKLITNKP